MLSKEETGTQMLEVLVLTEGWPGEEAARR